MEIHNNLHKFSKKVQKRLYGLQRLLDNLMLIEEEISRK